MTKSLLANKVAIVTGASSGIGRATALALAAQGVKVALASRQTQVLTQLAGEIQAMGQEALVVTTDVSQQAQVNTMVESVLQFWGYIDILVSNAGQYIRSPISQMTIAELNQSLAVNFYGGVYGVQAVVPHMLSHNSGHILLVSSMDGKIALPTDAPYVCAKFALNGFSATLRQELSRSGISVTLVLPGRVDTLMIKDLKVPWISAKIPPDKVAKEIIRAIHHPRAEVILPTQTILLYYISVFAPGLSDWLTRVLHLQGWSVL